MLYSVLAQEDGQGSTAVALCGGIFGLILGIVAIAALWRMFTKAGQPGWAAIIPIYNLIVLLQIVGRPWWWVLLMLIPIVSFVVLIIVYIDLAKSFGHGVGFGLGLAFLSFIFLCILAFGNSRYLGPAAAQPQ